MKAFILFELAPLTIALGIARVSSPSAAGDAAGVGGGEGEGAGAANLAAIAFSIASLSAGLGILLTETNNTA